LFNNTPNLAQVVHKFLDENAELKKKVEDYLKERILHFKQRLIDEKQTINGITTFIVKGHLQDDMLKDIAFQLRGEFPAKMCFAAGIVFSGKPNLMLMLSDDLVSDGLNASQIIREAARHIQGGGGGQAHFATAGGKNIAGLSSALEDMLLRIKN
jgi:alanyl-tRNA synthetase